MSLNFKIIYQKHRKAFYAIFSILLIILLLVLFLWYLAYKTYDPNFKTKLGVTYSKIYAQELGLDWQEAYLKTLDDLKVEYIRIPIYWNEIETQKDVFNFKDYDWMFNEAQKRNINVLPAIGYKLPRWPECFIPKWTNAIDQDSLNNEVLELVGTTVNHFKKYDNIYAWQVENEPAVSWFGHCPEPNLKLLKTEIQLVHNLDNRKIVLTDSGELSTWYPIINKADIFGTTLYRRTRMDSLNNYIFYYWMVPPSFYRLKAAMWGKSTDSLIIAELQTESWAIKNLLVDPLNVQFETMNPIIMEDTVRYANKTNFSQTYLWGVEWWYWLKEKQDSPEMWQTAKKLFHEYK